MAIMIISWLFSIVSLVSLLVADFFLMISPDTNSLLLALSLVASAPWIPLVFSHIKRDIEPLNPLTTRASLGGYLILLGLWMIMTFYFHASVSTQIFVLVLMFSAYFHIDARIFFAVALGGLITTVWSLVFDMSRWAESASIIVYLALVIGVFVEIGSRWLNKIHDGGKVLMHISSEFKTSYQQTLAEYTWIITVILQLIFIIALLGRGTLWNFDYQMLPYLSFGIWIFFALYLLASDKIYRTQDFMVSRLSKKSVV
jgi:hypothetical protein